MNYKTIILIIIINKQKLKKEVRCWR